MTTKTYKKERIVTILEKLSSIYSPTGMTKNALREIEKIAKKAKIDAYYTNKGALIVGSHKNPVLVISGHVDTLGLMVTEIKENGNLRFTNLGGPVLASFEGEYVKIYTESGKIYSGSLILDNPSSHVNRKAQTEERKLSTMHIRLDAEVHNAKDTEKLGIAVGDFIAFDSGFEFTDTGFIKSHFLDDKAGCAAMVEAFLTLGSKKMKELSIAFFFSNYEEVGHGAAAGIPKSAKELLVADMGVVGKGVAGDEYSVSICAKDSSGPYDHEMRSILTQISKKNKIPYKVDVFPFYGSDGTAALHAGMDIRVGLIGPGVSASHGNERTHIKGLNATKDLILAYIKASV